MASYHRIALAGATGNLGPSILAALIDAGFDVTVLTRSSSKANLPPSVKVAQVDYESQDSLVQALSGLDAVISNLPNHDGQATLIDASIKAGVSQRQHNGHELMTDMIRRSSASYPRSLAQMSSQTPRLQLYRSSRANSPRKSICRAKKPRSAGRA